jgi:hypothetical protein
MAVLSIFLLSILFPACTKTKTIYVEKEKIIRLCTREQAIQMAQEHKNKGTVVPEKDNPNDNRHKRTDVYIDENENVSESKAPDVFNNLSANKEAECPECPKCEPTTSAFSVLGNTVVGVVGVFGGVLSCILVCSLLVAGGVMIFIGYQMGFENFINQLMLNQVNII